VAKVPKYDFTSERKNFWRGRSRESAKDSFLLSLTFSIEYFFMNRLKERIKTHYKVSRIAQQQIIMVRKEEILNLINPSSF